MQCGMFAMLVLDTILIVGYAARPEGEIYDGDVQIILSLIVKSNLRQTCSKLQPLEYLNTSI